MKNVFITGSNRGLGLELVKQYLAKGRLVIATCRDRSKAPDLEKLRNQFKSKLKVNSKWLLLLQNQLNHSLF